ncbi:MAG: Glu-tRNA(Gln) amidotransferase subunit GatE [Asgard group archaeon]|nr:Glu-tRNA(Gln) amidotransferase subunit GatE [Asgard group archaeon]
MAQAAKTKSQLDYSALGLKCGLELHQQLETGRKLFCHCKTELRLDKPQITITRHMRPTLSELGEYDKAALMEFKKKKEIIYEIHDSVCSYEIDETPPFDPDPNAIDLAITIARLLNMDVLDEIHVNRKQYLDGSIPTGFQRTMIIGMGGRVKAAGKTINLDILALEEDSCREISNIGNTITWRVDRLGIPLVEIATKTIEISEPNEIKLIAEGIGRILRATGKVKRGLGTIRQDLNISIEKGARIEIKGVQVLDMLPEYVVLEVERQLALLEIKNSLEKKKLTSDMYIAEYKDCKEIFTKTSSKLLKKAMKNKQQVFGVKLLGMKGILSKKIQGEKTFGKEIAERVKVITGLGGILHTDELQNYGVKEGEISSLCTFFKCKINDAVALVIGKKEEVIPALAEIIIRVKEIFSGVPEETRHANEDGTTSFRRYLGGAGRMYPDTDSYPIVITDARIKRIEEQLPELPDKKEERYVKDLKLPEEIAKELAISQKADLFDELVKFGIESMLVAVTLEQTMKALAREKINIENITEKRIKDIFTLLKNKRIAKEAIEPLLKHSAENPKDKLDHALELLELELISKEQLNSIIDEIIKENIDFIKENGQRALGKLMGHVMEKVRGKIDGKIVNDTLNKKFKSKLKELDLKN